MKRIALACILLTAGVIGLSRLAHRIDHARFELRQTQAACRKQTEDLALLREGKVWLTAELAKRREQLRSVAPTPPLDLDLIACLTKTNGLATMPAEVRDRLVEELGLDWHASKDFVLVSKDILKELSLTPVNNVRLSEVACAVLAITPEERGYLESALVETQQALLDWASTNLKRAEPSGDDLVKLTLPANPELAQSLTNRLFSAMDTVLGHQRSRMLQHYAQTWLQDDMGCFGGIASSLTIKRRAGTTDELYFELSLNGSWNGTGLGRIHSGPIVLEGTIPSLFHKLFPGSWRQIALPESSLPVESAPEQ